MTNIENYSSLHYHMEIINDLSEGGYVASYPDLPGCLTCGDTLKEVVKNADEAKREWLLAAMEEGIDIPEPSY
ncbi:MAG: type II toxin-antitoxin system HicB family antitoxin [Erysipelotrichaceae bacterium]|nr:type II toxin-antitoxin system HicB family antitoxin [Erysipelotrichaceae bacterium]MDY5276873.1 type II toxin-antitoxin system HicB family antitoxin [Erysipelotrichaceae bacterium]